MGVPNDGANFERLVTALTAMPAAQFTRLVATSLEHFGNVRCAVCRGSYATHVVRVLRGATISHRFVTT